MKEIKVFLARLKGISHSCASVKTTDYVEKVVVDDYNKVIEDLGKIAQVSLEFLLIPSSQLSNMGYGEFKCKGIIFKSKLDQAIEFVQAKYEITGDISNLGNVIKSIADPEIKERCLDILAADRNFDRVIREATTILEDRIRQKSDPQSRLNGIALVDNVLNPSKGTLEIEGTPNEQEGFYQLFRGTMLSFRDESHHRLVDDLAREDALKVMILIDLLLQILSKAKRRA